MLKMKKIRKLLNQQVNGKFAATIIGVVAITIPIIALRDIDWENVELSFLSVVVPILYAVSIAGFILLVLGKQGRNITSKEMDEKIARVHSQIQKRLVPVWWALAVAWLIWSVYLVWKLRTVA